LEKIKASFDRDTVIFSVAAFIILFAAGFLLYPGGDYGENIDVTANSENPEQLIKFDNRNVTLGYNETTSQAYVNVEGRREELNIEGRQNDIFAVDGKVYMFYFESDEDFIRLIRIEEL